MNDIRDKVFDQLIKDKLEGFLPEVPTTLWDRIHVGLEEQDQKTSPAVVPLYTKESSRWWIKWSYAAAVAVFLGIGLTFVREPNEVIYLSAQQQQQEAIEHQDTRFMEEAQQAFQDKHQKNQGLNQKTTTSNKVTESPARSVAKATEARPIVQHTDDGSKPHQKLALVQANHDISPKEQAAEIQLAVEPFVVEENAFTYAQVADTDVVIVDEPGPTNADKRRFGVSNVLNYVVGVVDKNEEKVLAFNHDDEGSISLAFNRKALKKRKQSYAN